MKKNVERIINNRYCFAFIFNVIIFSLFMVFSNHYYDMADTQVFSQQIAAGYYNIIYTNYFLCYMCGLVQNLIYPINAYVLIELLLSFLAFYMLTIVFIEKFNKKISAIILFFVFSFFGVNHYSTFSYTLTTALLGVSGFLVLIHYIDKKEWIRGVVLGSLLVLFSSMYRFEEFEVVLLCSGVFYLVYKISLFLKQQKFCFVRIIKFIFAKRFIFVFILLMFITFAVNLFSTMLNTNTPELKYYKQYTNLRSEVWDYNYIPYDQLKDGYDKIGVSENDLAMLDFQYMDDEGAFTIDKLEAIKDLNNEYKSEINSPLSVLLDMVHIEIADAVLAVTDKGLLLWALLITIILFIFLQKKKQYFIPITLIIIDFALYYYLWLSGRCVYRAIYGAVLCSILFILYSIDRDQFRNNIKKYQSLFIKLISIIVVIISIIFTPLSFVGNLHQEQAVEKNNGYYDTLSYIKRNNGKQFVFTKGSSVIPVDTYQNPFFVNVPEYLENTIYFDGTYYKSRFNNDMLKKFGTDNLYKYLINNKNVYLVDSKETNYCKNLVIYLNEHYSEGFDIVADKKMSIGDYNFYSITTNK